MIDDKIELYRQERYSIRVVRPKGDGLVECLINDADAIFAVYRDSDVGLPMWIRGYRHLDLALSFVNHKVGIV